MVSFRICAVIAAATALGVAAADAKPPLEWHLVRSVDARNGGTIDFVVIPDLKKHDREHYLGVSEAVCGERKQCMVNFWTDPALVPSSAGMTLQQSGAMTAVYERHPTFDKPHLTMACWLYPNKDLAELMNCGYFPGARARWQR